MKVTRIGMWAVLVVVLLAGCRRATLWSSVSGGDNLLTDASWACERGVQTDQGTLQLSAGDTYATVINSRGLVLEAPGDFGVSVQLSTEAATYAAFSLYGALAEGDWWEGIKRLDVGLSEGRIVVTFYNGASFMPALSESFEVKGLKGTVEVGVRRVGQELIIRAGGAEVGRIADPGAFPNGIVYLGFVVAPGNAMRVGRFSVEAPEGQGEGVRIVSQTASFAYVPAPKPLRELAERRRLWIGAAVSPDPLRCEPIYGEVLGSEFNFLTTENALKFGPVHPTREHYDFLDADTIVAFAEAHGMAVRGHTLVWHESQPAWIEEADFSEAEWNQVLETHIQTVVGRYRGRIRVWDVVNEAIGESGVMLRKTMWSEGVGQDYIDKAFRWAHEADPDALLFYNDYGAEGLNGKSQQVYELVRGMVERGVPIHGVGLQMHLELGQVPKSEDILANMRRLGELGLQVHITELDVRVPVPASADLLQAQARVYGEMLDVCLQAGNCTGFVMWGFTDRYSWVPSFFPGTGAALIFDETYGAKPAYWALWEGLSGSQAAGPEQFGADCNCLP